MNNLDFLVNELNSLNENQLNCVNGGYTSATLTDLDDQDIVVNIYQCHCNKTNPPQS